LLVRAAAAELGSVGLAGAFAILELIESQDDHRFEPAAVRWASRRAGEVPGLTLASLRLAVDALDALRDDDARATLPRTRSTRRSASATRNSSAGTLGAASSVYGASTSPLATRWA
jgi:hypothetical protein